MRPTRPTTEEGVLSFPRHKAYITYPYVFWTDLSYRSIVSPSLAMTLLKDLGGTKGIVFSTVASSCVGLVLCLAVLEAEVVVKEEAQ